MRPGPLAIAFALLPGCTCSPRPHVGVHRDGGPAVVVVERRADAGPPGSPARPGARGSVDDANAFVDEHEPDDDVARAQPLEYPKGIRGALVATVPGRPDVDVFQWIPVAPAGAGDGRLSARIELDGPADATLDVLDKNGVPLLRALPGEHLLPNLALTAGEVCFLRVRAGRGASPAGAPAPQPGGAAATAAAPHPVEYRLVTRAAALQPGEEQEPDDSAEHASALAPSIEEVGYHGRPHDEDWLRLPEGIPAGSTLRLELSPVEGVAPGLRVRDAAGTLLAEAKGGRGDELRLRNAPAPPGGLVVVRAESGKNTEIPWRLRWLIEAPLSGAEVEPNGAAATATALTVDGGAPVRVAGFLLAGRRRSLPRASRWGRSGRRHHRGPGGRGRRRAPRRGRHHHRHCGTTRAPGARGKGRRLRALAEGGELLLRVAGRPRDTVFEAPYTLSVSRVVAPAAEAPTGGPAEPDPAPQPR